MSVRRAPAVIFAGGPVGAWEVTGIQPVSGVSLPAVSRLAVFDQPTSATPRAGSSDAAWLLRGAVSNARYTRRSEQDALTAIQAGLGGSTATRAALIAIVKSERWWQLAQDERRDIFGERSQHISLGRPYAAGIARWLYRARDLGEPFDFLTWFEYSPQQAYAFEELVNRLRATLEWTYIEREVDIRLAR